MKYKQHDIYFEDPLEYELFGFDKTKLWIDLTALFEFKWIIIQLYLNCYHLLMKDIKKTWL